MHHIWQLPLAVKLAQYKNVKLIFNAHEYYPLEFDDDVNWMKTTHLSYMQIAKNNLKHVDICFCVGQIIAEKYKKEFNLNSIVITNAKRFYNLKPSLLKQGEKIKIIHHGIALRARKIELMIDMMRFLDENYSLDLILVPGEEAYIEELKNKCGNMPAINFRNPVKTDEISNFINSYDIGAYILSDTNFNNTNALPNKFFEFIQARLAIAIAPSPEMKALVKNYDLGVVAEDFTPQALAKKIKELSADKIMYYKNQANRYAKELSVEHNEALIKKTVEELISK